MASDVNLGGDEMEAEVLTPRRGTLNTQHRLLARKRRFRITSQRTPPSGDRESTKAVSPYQGVRTHSWQQQLLDLVSRKGDMTPKLIPEWVRRRASHWQAQGHLHQVLLDMVTPVACGVISERRSLMGS